MLHMQAAGGDRKEPEKWVLMFLGMVIVGNSTICIPPCFDGGEYISERIWMEGGVYLSTPTGRKGHKSGKDTTVITPQLVISD